MPKVIHGYQHKPQEPWESVKAFPPGYLKTVDETEGKVIAAVVSYEEGLDYHTFIVFEDGTSICLKGFIVGERGGEYNLPSLGLQVVAGVLTRVQAKAMAESILEGKALRRQTDRQLRIKNLERQLAREREEA